MSFKKTNNNETIIQIDQKTTRQKSQGQAIETEIKSKYYTYSSTAGKFVEIIAERTL